MTDPLAQLRAALTGGAKPRIVGPWQEIRPGDCWRRYSVTGLEWITIRRDPQRSPASGKSRYRVSHTLLVTDGPGSPCYDRGQVANASGVVGMLTPTAAMSAADGWLRARGWTLLGVEDLPGQEDYGPDPETGSTAAWELAEDCEPDGGYQRRTRVENEVADAAERWADAAPGLTEPGHGDLVTGE